MTSVATIRKNLKELIVESLHLDRVAPADIGDDTRLFGDGLGLDSVDALELVVAMERAYGISVQAHDMDKSVFTSVTTLADFVAGQLANRPVSSTLDGR